MVKVLHGKIALVTGACHPRGIGRAIAGKLAAAGAVVIATDREGAEGSDTVVEWLRRLGSEAAYFPMDVTAPGQIADVVQRIRSQFSGLDLLVNNAGVAVGSEDFLQGNAADWQVSLDVNLMGIVHCCEAVLPVMLNQQRGCIVNVASLAGLGAMPAIPACYTASKFAAVGLTKQLALQYAGSGIRINAVCPGSVMTQMYDKALELIAAQEGVGLEQARAIENSAIPLGHSADPAVVGDTVVYLASDAASYITGVAMPLPVVWRRDSRRR